MYDGLNRRVGKKVGSTLTKQYTYIDKLRIAAEYDGSGTLISQFVYGDKPNVPEYIIQGSDKYKIVTDHLGSVRAVVHSGTGLMIQEINYDEFGRVLSDTNPGFQPFGFAGGMYDSATGIVHFGARDYNAETGRWMQKDPILFAGGDTNLYGYVVNDPINFNDPRGLFLTYIGGAPFDVSWETFGGGLALGGACALAGGGPLGFLGGFIAGAGTVGLGRGANMEFNKLPLMGPIGGGGGSCNPPGPTPPPGPSPGGNGGGGGSGPGSGGMCTA